MKGPPYENEEVLIYLHRMLLIFFEVLRTDLPLTLFI